MSERQDFIALEWVAGEIEETLKQAAQALEAYIANRDDATKLRFCLTHLHQVHGTLHMVEFFGAALLAEEMEGLAHALIQGAIHDSHVDDALAVLKNAIVQLPRYLDRVKESRHGLPATLLPVLNDLRAVRGESLLSETVLFAPNMATASANDNSAVQKAAVGELGDIGHKLRQMFQVALLGLIRGRDIKKNLNYLAKVCARLVKLSEGYPLQPLWRVNIAVLEGLLNSTIESSVAIKILLRQVDRQLKLIVEQGEQAFEQSPPESLLKNLLYYVARSKANSRFINEIKTEYNLDASLLGETELDDESLATPNSSAMQTVVVALVQELTYIDQAFAEASNDSSALTNILPLFRRVSDTMAILGMGAALKQIQEPYTRLAKALATQDAIESDELQSIASLIKQALADLNPDDVIVVEQTRGLFNDSEEAQEHLDRAFDSVVRESRVGLEQAKESIIEYVATQWDQNCLVDLPSLLAEIRGSLEMVPLSKASRVLASCEKFIQQKLIGAESVPDWQMLDTLADAITSVDYYLERLVDDSNSENSTILDVAADSVAELGYPIESVAAPVEPSAEATVTEATSAEQLAPEDAASEEITAEPPTLTEEPPLLDVEPPTLSQDDIHVDDIPVLAEVIPFKPSVAEETVATPAEHAEDDEDFDPEIVEIFIEEAGEVLETIDEFLPQWQADSQDEESRSTIRRAFHTLKGSGRMVGAEDIGELAWSIENMLNRVIEGAVNMDPVRFDLIAETKDKVPELVAAFEHRQPVDKVVLENIISRANALATEQNPVLAEAAVAPQADSAAESVNDALVDEEIDQELVDIFAAEATTHCQVLDEFIAYCKNLAAPAELTDELQRALHTLKGSANMAGIVPVAVVATPIELVVKELRASQLKVNEPMLALLEKGSLFIKAGIEQLTTTPMQLLPGAEAYVEELFAELKLRIAATADQTDEDNGIPPEALNQFLTDSLDLVMEISGRLVLWQQNDLEQAELEQFETLMGRFIVHAESVNMLAPVEFGQALQALYRRAAGDVEVNDSYFSLANAANDCLIDMLDQIAGHQTPLFEESLLDKIQQFEFEPKTLGDESAADIEHTETSEDFLLELSADEELLADSAVVELDLDATIGMPAINADEIDLPEFGFDDEELSDIEPASADIETPQPLTDDAEITAAMSDFSDALGATENTTELEQSSEHVDELGSDRDNLATAIDSVDVDDEVDAEIIEIFLEEADELLEAMEETVHSWGTERGNRAHYDEMLRILHTLKGGARLSAMKELGDLSHNFETSLMDMDGGDITIDDDTFATIQDYQDQLIAMVQAIKAGEAVAPVADIATQSVKDTASHTSATVEIPTLDDDVTAAEIDNLSAAPSTAEHTELTDETFAKQQRPSTQLEPTARPPASSSSDVVPFIAAKSREAVSTDKASPLGDSKKGPQEVVKVSAQLLEELVNLAGETSISRGRAEEQISELVFSLEEMQITVDRLQEQVRRLDMETEQQILYRQEQVESEGLEGFDPLEMDRYSQLQQLSRSLLESSSDLTDIKNTLSDKSRDMETLLIQQSRINTELQEGLMRSRMVPFSRMVPRLRRIIRQVSGELNKKVDFHLDNVEGELDRTVLERMVAPLEHMLRNAVDHGIEDMATREAAGKSPRGNVSLDLSREGGEIVLTLSDDGAGVDLSAVRHKAIERGLMEPNAELSDHEILQFILQAGFSTATAVTQISGRGVGMDVVHSEIKQLGGSMDIESKLGVGSRFIVRLPFTVSVNRALMVNVGGDSYAIPLNSIEGIVRVSPFELEAYYQPDAPMFEYAGQPYLLRYMGALLQRGDKPILEGQTMPLPVVLVRGAEHSVAVQVDSLMGSREIVVKPLGPQFSMVQGLTGATVLGDGSVVVILDLLAMIRADASHLHKDLQLGHEDNYDEGRSILVMVVDDSVTVRKVTSRLLERQGMEVLLAKDGVDAVTQLQEIERVPDIMLLDIEMPRMDGFEVASRVRHNNRLKDLPIIMITSRTGEKHRERALSLGVNEYMGKPYQELELLENINLLLGTTVP